MRTLAFLQSRGWVAWESRARCWGDGVEGRGFNDGKERKMSVIWGAHFEQGSQRVALQAWLPCRLFSETLTDLAAHCPHASGQLLWSWSLRLCRRLESKSRHLRVLRQRGLLPAQSPSVRWLVLLWTSCHQLGQVLIDAWHCVLNTFTLLLSPPPTFVCLFLNPQRHLACEFVPFPDRLLSFVGPRTQVLPCSLSCLLGTSLRGNELM